jgi:hypothetical protein
VTEEFRKERAMTVRAIAEKADPLTKRRLLDLAAKYARAQKATDPDPFYLRRTSSVSALVRAPQGWSKRFDEPIVPDDGTTLTTLREAVEYLAKTVPKAAPPSERAHSVGPSHQVCGARLPNVLCPGGNAAGYPPESRAGFQSGSQGPSLGKTQTEARPIAEAASLYG